MSFDPKLLQLYAVTDRQWTGRQTLIQQLEAALQGRHPGPAPGKDLDDSAPSWPRPGEVVALCHRYGVPCLINDNLPVALAAGADRGPRRSGGPARGGHSPPSGARLPHRGHRQNPGPGPGCPGRRGGLPGGWGLLPSPTKPNAKGSPGRRWRTSAPPSPSRWWPLGESPSRMPGSSRGWGWLGWR